MWPRKHSIFFSSSLILLFLFQSPTFAAKKAYIVYLGSHEHGKGVTQADFDGVTETHHDLLGFHLGSYEKAREAILYSYTRHINGFAAVLDEKEAIDIAKDPNVVSVFPNQRRKLLTTHSWEFMSSMEEEEEKESGSINIPSTSIFEKARFGEDTIIGHIDSGAWPESPSFSDERMGPIPSKWKGTCQSDSIGFRCNRKLIGARYFYKGYASETDLKTLKNITLTTSRDYYGHGTHTLSTLGGNFVEGANVLGMGNGTAKGGSSKARIATYKVCWPAIDDGEMECFDADILAAIEAAMHDGVDAISLSLGVEPPLQYHDDLLAIGAFHAVNKGITVICAAGNSGPSPKTVANIAPWVITVGASAMDRKFEALVELPNGQILKGSTLSEALPEKKLYPLINATLAKKANASDEEAMFCNEGTINPQQVKGKILLCLRGDAAVVKTSLVAFEAGAAGMILRNTDYYYNDFDIIAQPHFLPTSQLTYEDGLSLLTYINSTKNPMAYIHPPQTKLHVKPSPYMAIFSSRGPNQISPEILKPDIIAPGANIIASNSQEANPTGFESDKRRFPFITMSGTSMAAPHVTGVVGLLKTLYPDWSPSAIKSAIMTTAGTRDNTNKLMLDWDFTKATPYACGSGHIRPNRAMDPGLVYDLTPTDYINFLCASGYNQNQITTITGAPYQCPYKVKILDFNYPAITIPRLNGSVSLTRKVKNVGTPGTYEASLHVPAALNITVDPSTLKFDKVNEEKSFKVTVEVTRPGFDIAYGRLTWSDGKHFVRSPVIVRGIMT